MRIAFVVQGRFHIFELARALLGQGHEVLVLTTEPRLDLGQFGVPPQHVRSLRSWGLCSRLLSRVGLGQHTWVVRWLHRWFGSWARRQLRKLPPFDVLHVFSGVAEEIFSDPQIHGLRTLLRGSAHIDVQAKLLADEARRTGLACEQPTEWIRQRERREYALAEVIVVLSGFARDSFVDQGIAAERLAVVPLGADAARFVCAPGVHAARQQRAAQGERLRVLTVGHFSLQKGAFDLVGLWNAGVAEFEFRFVGGTGDAAPLRGKVPPEVDFHPRVPQQELPGHFEWADVFVFPTIQDGFAALLVQAMAAGLPIIATTNCGGPDLLQAAGAGQIVPIRDAPAILAILRGLAHDRELRLAWSRAAATPAPLFDWDHAATMFASAMGAFLVGLQSR